MWDKTSGKYFYDGVYVWEDDRGVQYVQGVNNISEASTALYAFQLEYYEINPESHIWFDDNYLKTICTIQEGIWVFDFA